MCPSSAISIHLSKFFVNLNDMETSAIGYMYALLLRAHHWSSQGQDKLPYMQNLPVNIKKNVTFYQLTQEKWCKLSITRNSVQCSMSNVWWILLILNSFSLGLLSSWLWETSEQLQRNSEEIYSTLFMIPAPVSIDSLIMLTFSSKWFSLKT